MKNKYAIGFIVLSVTAILIITCAYQLSYYRAKERAQEARIKTEKEPAMEPEETIPTEGGALKEDCYYLMEVNGYIVVYLSDKKTPYEYTDILFDELPEKLREEIRNGKYIEDTKALYGFLENYSS
ncbi:hypothetical protein AALA78_07490 [Lachnospiraceae bacterium 42-17]|nr:hypothetical protein [Dorea sp.]